MEGVGESHAAVEELEFHQHRCPDNIAACLVDEILGCCQRPPGRENIVDDQHSCSSIERILMNLERVCSVLEVVGDADDRTGKFARLANKADARTDPLCDRSSEEEPSRLDANNDVDAACEKRFCHLVNGLEKRGW